MSKPVLVKIKKRRIPGEGTNFTWPAIWLELTTMSLANIYAYEDTGQTGEVEERAIGVVADSMFDIAVADPNIEPIDVQTANMLGRKWRPDVVVINDEERVKTIMRKVSKGQELTNDELSAIDEDKRDVPGIIKKQFDITDYL